MHNIMLKEFKLSSSKISYFFILFGLMFFLPGYPILLGVFFTTLGIFQSFQNVRETNDILFSALLPIKKKDVVKGKYLFTAVIELCSLSLMSVAVILRITILSHSTVYRENALMNGNLFALGLAFLLFGIFNLIFLSGFFNTAYKYGGPFIAYIIAFFLIVAISESLHYIPGLQILNSFGMENFNIQLVLLLIGILIYILLTYISYIKSCKRFERIDL